MPVAASIGPEPAQASSHAGMGPDRPTVVGAGVLGLTIAYRLARRGFRPLICDPNPLGDNASGVAAGMIAPVFETLLDGDPAHLTLLTAARDLWPSLAAEVGGGAYLHRCGAMWVGSRGTEFEALAERGAALGIGALTGERARALRPELASTAARLLYAEGDWRCDTGPMLAALRDAALLAGAELQAGTWSRSINAGPVIIAGGYEARALAAAAPELALLTPIKGQLIRLQGGPREGPVVRGAGVYVVPGEAGAVVGASMEAGLADRVSDPVVGASLLSEAIALLPSLADVRWRPEAAVRATTPDGLPLVGPSTRAGIVLAVGARRNGWLLAPLVAELVTAYLASEVAGPLGRMLDTRRFFDAPCWSPTGSHSRS